MLRTACTAVLLLVLTGCSVVGGGRQPSGPGPAGGGTSPEAAPRVGACRVLVPHDVDAASNATAAVACSRSHTAQTFAVGSFPASVAHRGRDDRALGRYVYGRCQPLFRRFLGADDSLLLRSTLTWAWFRPSAGAWSAGARSWRCDVVAEGPSRGAFAKLPVTARGLLLRKPDDRWLTCVDGPRVAGAAKVPCSRQHTWRAVTSIVLGARRAAYPGDRLVEVRTRDYCSDSVGAWLNYPVDYQFGYTWYHAAEWATGNRRSVCWARTTQ